MLKENRLDRGIRLFDNPILDVLSRVHPIVPALMWIPVAVVAIVLGASWLEQPLHALWLVPVGWVTWWFAEYIIHRGFFHYTPRAAWLRRIFYYVHEHHHRYQEFDRLLAPPMMSLPIFVFFFGFFYLTVTLPFASWGAFGCVLGGFVLGYLAYDYIHLYTHFVKPTSRLGKLLRRLHLQHHFARPDRWYGISCPWIDYLFGTAARKGEKSLNAKNNRDSASKPYFGDDVLPAKVLAWEAAHGAPTAESVDADGAVAATTDAREPEAIAH